MMKKGIPKDAFFVNLLKFKYFGVILLSADADSTRGYNVCYHYGADEYAPQ